MVQTHNNQDASCKRSPRSTEKVNGEESRRRVQAVSAPEVGGSSLPLSQEEGAGRSRGVEESLFYLGKSITAVKGTNEEQEWHKSRI